MIDRLPHSQDGSPLSANCIRDNDSLVIHMPVEITPLWREVPVPMQMTGIIIHNEGSHNFPADTGNLQVEDSKDFSFSKNHMSNTQQK